MMLATVVCAWQAAPVIEASAPLTLLTGAVRRRDGGAERLRQALLGKSAATTVMTGNVTTLVIEMVDCCAATRSDRPLQEADLAGAGLHRRLHERRRGVRAGRLPRPAAALRDAGWLAAAAKD
jgi:hypothetical protein